MRISYLNIFSLSIACALSGCASPISIGHESANPATRSNAFGVYPKRDVDRCAALTTQQARSLYPDILPTGRCNPNNHHDHDHEINTDHNHD